MMQPKNKIKLNKNTSCLLILDIDKYFNLTITSRKVSNLILDFRNKFIFIPTVREFQQ